MKAKAIILFLLGLIFLHSCKKDSSSYEYLPPPSLKFELIDRASGQNLITNGTLYTSDIKFINSSDKSIVPYLFSSDQGLVLIRSIGWETEIVNCKLEILGEEIGTLYVDAERIHAKYEYTKYHEIKLQGCMYMHNKQTGVYRIYLE